MLPDRPVANARRASHAARRFVTSAAIAFALTFVAAVLALALGVLPHLGFGTAASIDPAVVLLFAPLCALVLAVLVEVLRSLADHPAEANARDTRLVAWRPGRGEG